MNRARVICHMMTTIDGKISIDFDGNNDYVAVGDEYDRLTFSYGEAYGCGRATFKEDKRTISYKHFYLMWWCRN